VAATLIAQAEGNAMARVTVIDDSVEFLSLMEEILVGLGHSMVGLEAVKTSFEEVVATRPELMVVDLRLENTPEQVSGWELVILARAHRELLRVPIILCTADLFELKKRTRELEQIAGVHVLTKPFELDNMTQMITRLLSQERPSAFAAD
jgi:CheY-like chemotaxis protein